ncbi:cytochrome P450 monooxygenase-like protein [Phaeosphaeriaceae sp. PMI808]|nr:cytochrome P450 monooxygenase-like protein [Phaeosphaeriaceae sp. PMI808]
MSAFSRLAHTFQTVVIASLVIAACAYVPKLLFRMQLSKLPMLDGGENRHRYLEAAKGMYKSGYQKFKDRVYLMATGDEVDIVVVPLAMLPELRKLSDDFLSFPKAVDSYFETKYTGLHSDITAAGHTIRSELTPRLSRLNHTIYTAVDAAMREQIPPCNDWTEVDVNSKLLDVIARISGRIFVGPELSKEPEYLECARMYTVFLSNAVTAIKHIRPILRPFLVTRLPEIKRLRNMEKRAVKYLEPIVNERLEAEKDPNWEKPEDMLQWLIDSRAEVNDFSVEVVAKTQLALIFAAIHTTSISITNNIYTLAVTPEYIQPLREEIITAMAENEGNLSVKALHQMVKLDSYMKETARVYPFSFSTFNRKVLKGFKLSNGQYIPPGALVGIPADAIHNDLANYPNPDEFDGFRHYKLRQGGTAADISRNQFVSTNEVSLLFGHGRHACPGRFFASNEIKMILARLIMGYDIKMPGDAKERHENTQVGRFSSPKPKATVMLKSV